MYTYLEDRLQSQYVLPWGGEVKEDSRWTHLGARLQPRQYRPLLGTRPHWRDESALCKHSLHFFSPPALDFLFSAETKLFVAFKTTQYHSEIYFPMAKNCYFVPYSLRCLERVVQLCSVCQFADIACPHPWVMPFECALHIYNQWTNAENIIWVSLFLFNRFSRYTVCLLFSCLSLFLFLYLSLVLFTTSFSYFLSLFSSFLPIYQCIFNFFHYFALFLSFSSLSFSSFLFYSLYSSFSSLLFSPLLY